MNRRAVRLLSRGYSQVQSTCGLARCSPLATSTSALVSGLSFAAPRTLAGRCGGSLHVSSPLPSSLPLLPSFDPHDSPKLAAALRLGAHRPNVLVTIRPSLYAENARWGLDHNAVPYEEEHYAPGVSALGVLAAAKWGAWGLCADRSSTRLSTPLLLTRPPYPGPHLVHKSTPIVAWASTVGVGRGKASLFPTPQTDALVTRYVDNLGPHTRRVAYALAMGTPDVFRDVVLTNLGDDSIQAAVVRPCLEPIRAWIMRELRVHEPGRVAKSRGRVLSEFDAAATRLAQRSADFWDGDAFSAADIAFSCMASPVLAVRPWEGYGAYVPLDEALPDEYLTLVSELRAHPAGQHALRMFRLHRGRRAVPGLPPIPGAHPGHDTW